MLKPFFKYPRNIILKTGRVSNIKSRKWCLLPSLFAYASCVFIPSFAQAQEESNYDHSSYIGLKLAACKPGAELKPSDKINSPNLALGYGFGLEGVWLFHRNLGVYGLLNYSVCEPRAKTGNSSTHFVNVLAKGKMNNSRALGGLFLSFPFKVNTLELKAGIGYGSVHGLFKTPFNAFNDPTRRIIRYQSEGLVNQIGVQFRTELYDKVNVAFFADYNFMNGSYEVNDFYQAGTVQYSEKLRYDFYEFGMIVLFNFNHSKKSIFHK